MKNKIYLFLGGIMLLITACSLDEILDKEPDIETKREWLINHNDWEFENIVVIDADEEIDADQLENQLFSVYKGTVYKFLEDGTGLVIFQNGSKTFFNYKMGETEITLTGGVEATWWGYEIENGRLSFYMNSEILKNRDRKSYSVRFSYN